MSILNLELLIVNYLGGPDRDRTGDLYIANVALCQLSYRPLSDTPKNFKEKQKISVSGDFIQTA